MYAQCQHCSDGISDAFTLYSDAQQIVEIIDLQIFDRWGERLFCRNHFAPNDPSLEWNGRFLSKLVLPGTYLYLSELRLTDGRRERIIGSVTVVR